MNPEKSPEVTVQTLLALSKEDEAVRLIAERLRVKEMGPADHIRTKHEVKAFVETRDVKAAEALIKQANERTATYHSVTNRMTEQQQRGQQIGK